MLAVYIIGGILLLLFLLTLPRVRITVEYEDELIIKLGYLFITLTLYPAAKKKPKKPNPASKKPKKQRESVNYLEQFHRIKDHISPALDIMSRFSGHIVIAPFRLGLVMVGSDAAQLAVEYGALCGAFYTAFALIKTRFNIKNENINISVDYLKKQFEFRFYTVIRFRVLFALTSGISILKLIIRYKKSQIKEGNDSNG